MDITLAKTFLEVASAGSLVQAAGRLHVTQAAVSARLRALEEQLGCRLFVRNKAGARLTAQGHTFVPHATLLLRVWQRARVDVARRPGCEAVLTLGAEMSLWSGVLLNWVMALRTDRPEVAVHTEVDPVDRLLDRVQNGTLDIAVLYSGQRRPGVDNRLVLEEELIPVSSRPNAELEVEDYVYVDWGPDFRAQHDQRFPELRNAPLVVDLGPLALRYLLRLGGSGYFRTRAVHPHLQSGALHRVKNAPAFSYSLYVAHSKELTAPLYEWAIDRLTAATEMPLHDWA